MEDTDIVIHVIDKDLGRTFPSHVLFAQKGSQGCVRGRGSQGYMKERVWEGREKRKEKRNHVNY